MDQNQVAICSDGAGDAIIAWRDYRNDWKSDIYAQRITASGALAEGWPANGVPVCAADSVQEAPQVVADGERGAIFVWHDQRNGPRFTNSDIYGQRINAAGGVAEGWVVNGLQICGAPESQIYPVLISDQTGGAIVAWNDFRSRPGAPDIYAQRITAVGAVALGWESDGAPICTAPKDQSGPLLTEDGEGGALLVWNDYRQGLPVVINDLYAQRISSSGALRWTLDGVPVSAAANAQALAGITSDANGGALIAWQDNRIDPDAWDIYAQHLSASGMPAEGWPADGIPVSLAEGRQENPAIVADGHGGGITTWCDFRNGHDADIYAQHVTQQGIAIPIDPRAVVVQGLRPNPTQGETSITFMIGASEKVWASVYDLSGRRLKTLLTPSVLSAGLHYVTWDARDANGAVVRPGVYLVRIATPTGAETRSLVVLR